MFNGDFKNMLLVAILKMAAIFLKVPLFPPFSAIFAPYFDFDNVRTCDKLNIGFICCEMFKDI